MAETTSSHTEDEVNNNNHEGDEHLEEVSQENSDISHGLSDFATGVASSISSSTIMNNDSSILRDVNSSLTLPSNATSTNQIGSTAKSSSLVYDVEMPQNKRISDYTQQLTDSMEPSSDGKPQPTMAFIGPSDAPSSNNHQLTDSMEPSSVSRLQSPMAFIGSSDVPSSNNPLSDEQGIHENAVDLQLTIDQHSSNLISEEPENVFDDNGNTSQPMPHLEAVLAPDEDELIARLQQQWEARLLAQPGIVVEAVDVTADESNPQRRNKDLVIFGFSISARKLWCTSFLVFLLLCIVAIVTAIVFAGRGSAKTNRQYLVEAFGPYIVRNGSEKEDLAVLEDPNSPQARALSWMVESDDFSARPEQVETKKLLERYVLAVLYFSASGLEWSNTFPFMDRWSDICGWSTRDPNGDGIFCDEDPINDGAVTGVSLRELQLQGTLPWELSLLTDVTSLRLNGNTLTGTIPEEMSALTKLSQLWLHSNALSGKMTSSISLPSVLLDLNMDGNYLSRTLPIEWLHTMTSLTNLQLGGNLFKGTLPTELAHLSHLTSLQLSGNHFNGTIPTEWNSLSKLTLLGLGGNNLTGTIPHSFGYFSAVLKELHLEGNFFTGTLPSEWPGIMASLTHLGLGSNRLQGQLPSTWEDFEQLLYLDLGKNSLTGQISSVFGRMSSLQYLSLKGNVFTGTIPVELAMLPNILELDISGNSNFSGTIPLAFRNWDASRTFRVHATNFTDSLESLFCLADSTPPTLYADCLVEEDDTLCSCCAYCCSPVLPFYCESNEGEQARHAKFLSLLEPHISQNEDADQFVSYGPSSPQRQALSWMMSVDNFSSNFEELSIETLLARYALAVLYFSMSGWSQDSPFLNETLSVCDWGWDFQACEDCLSWRRGGSCNDGVVEKISLRNLRLIGTIPWNEISLLGQLTSLDLGGNYLTGTLPSQINGLSKLTFLSLVDNLLTGTLPSSLSQYPKTLEHFDVASNELEGPIPTAIGLMRSLEELFLDSMGLTGSLPTELGDLTRLWFLWLYSNQLSGTLPTELGNLTNLHYLFLGLNPSLTGTVPAEYGNLSYLKDFYIDDTSLTGSVDSLFCSWEDPPWISADCLGDEPELECSCCSWCCLPDGSKCFWS